MQEPHNDIDTETLQAQIDLAMAQTQNLIASWLPGPSGSLTQSSSRAAEAEAELQVLLRRPPRLGVGAPIPETHAPAQARLVQKLQRGNNRTPETANGDTLHVKKEEGREESSEEESRIGATRKRTIIDPFEAARKKRRKRRKEAEEIGDATQGTGEGRQTSGEGMMDAFDATVGPTPQKKKKKKKSRLLEGHDGEPRTANVIVPPNDGPLRQSLQETSEGKTPLRQEFRGGLSEASDTTPSSSATFPTSPAPFPGLPIQRSPICAENATILFPPILNLAGPPSMRPEGNENQPHKKRRRKRRKKKPASDPS
ncbi:hypothetical protein EI94DRAFT_1785562 [Lactarius quietus]|nr:hypothetical protein EI94DRAFT_1785562 [Lactarius quietus]